MFAARMGVRAALTAVVVLACVAVMAVPSWGAVTSCTGPIGPGTISGSVSAGAGCFLEPGTTVTGNVTVNPGGSLKTSFFGPATISGNVTSEGATEVQLVEVAIGGNVKVTGTTARVFLDGGSVNGNVVMQGNCCSLQVVLVTIGGNVAMEHNTGFLVNISTDNIAKNIVVQNNTLTSSENGVTVNFSQIGGNVTVNDNSVTGGGLITVFRNAVGKNLDCEGNEPPAVTFGATNTARKTLGQCESL